MMITPRSSAASRRGDTIGYDPNTVSSDSYYDDGSGMMIF